MSAKDTSTKPAPLKMICQNRKALHDFAFDYKIEAGLVLTGSEVKSCRDNKVQLTDAHVNIRNGEAFLLGSYIAEYGKASHFNHEPTRTRKLLMHQREIVKLAERIKLKGETAVPLSMYFKGPRVKVELGVGKGRKAVDRRARVKEREADREIERTLRRGR